MKFRYLALALLVSVVSVAPAASAPDPRSVVVVVPAVTLQSTSVLRSAVVAAGYEPVVWDIFEQGPPTKKALAEHRGKTLIRVIPDGSEASAIGPEEDDALFWHLLYGGNLLLAGNDVAKSAADTNILLDVGAKYVADDSGTLAVRGAACDEDLSSQSLFLASWTPEGGPVRPDVVAPIDDAVVKVALVYETGWEGAECAAALKVDG